MPFPRLPVPPLARSLVLLIALLLATTAWGAEGKLRVYFLDIGQGDSELIISPTGKTMLIDGGPPDHKEHLVQRLKELVHGPLDLVVLTHPHLDHLGGLPDVIEQIGAKRYMDDGFVHPGKTYSHLLDLVAQKVGKRVTPEVDPKHPQDLITIGLGGGVTFTILWPRRPVEDFLTNTRSDPNSNSIVGKLVYGKTAFMLVGDAEPDTEEYLLQKRINFRTTVLKVGHHGGRHSSTTPWLDALKPKAAVISCGVGNDYGHPGKETLERLQTVGAHVYRTDTMGEVYAESDGTSVVMHAEREDVAHTTFVGDVTGPVQLGPIVAGERHVSQATLDDRKRYHKDGSDSQPDPEPEAQATPASAQLPPPAPPPSVDALIPESVKAQFPEHDAQKVVYIASKHSDVFHRADCAAVAKIKPSNRITFDSRAAAAAKHRPAGDCNP